MKAKDVKRMGHYIAKVSGKLVEVRIDAEHHAGGWMATNLQTGKQVRIKSARRLRGLAPGHAAEKTTTDPKAKANPSITDGANVGAPETKGARTQRKHGRKATGKMFGTEAAAKLLEETGTAMGVTDIARTIIKRGLWAPRGKTPVNTLYAAIITEIKKKGDDSRFSRAEERGKFMLHG